MTDNAQIEIDLGIAALKVTGSEDETVSDIYEIYTEERDELIESIGDLKREDFDIQSEYDQLPDQNSGTPSSTFN